MTDTDTTDYLPSDDELLLILQSHPLRDDQGMDQRNIAKLISLEKRGLVKRVWVSVDRIETVRYE